MLTDFTQSERTQGPTYSRWQVHTLSKGSWVTKWDPPRLTPTLRGWIFLFYTAGVRGGIIVREFGKAVLKDLLSNPKLFQVSSRDGDTLLNKLCTLPKGHWVMNRLEVRDLQQSKELIPGVTRPLWVCMNLDTQGDHLCNSTLLKYKQHLTGR